MKHKRKRKQRTLHAGALALAVHRTRHPLAHLWGPTPECGCVTYTAWVIAEHDRIVAEGKAREPAVPHRQ